MYSEFYSKNQLAISTAEWFIKNHRELPTSTLLEAIELYAPQINGLKQQILDNKQLVFDAEFSKIVTLAADIEVIKRQLNKSKY